MEIKPASFLKNRTSVYWAAPGVHEKVVQILDTAFVARGKVLDLGCGPGALSDRLHKLGFSVVAADKFPEVFLYHSTIPFIQQDVEDEWVNIKDGFDVIIAVEIVEHLENPYLFIRRCFEKLRTGGTLVLTTPNAAHYVSRLMFLRSGLYDLYSPSKVKAETLTLSGNKLPQHINLFTDWMVRFNLERAGFTQVRFFKSNNWLSGLFPFPRHPLRFLPRFLYHFLGTLCLPLLHSEEKGSVITKTLIVSAKKAEAVQ